MFINSPGGEATEGVAIYNSLVNHPAHVDVVIDGLAASAASLVAMAGDTVTMSPGTELMIHEPWLICMGSAEDMAKTADLLEHMSANLASIYQERAGGTLASWQKAMADETWYNPDEAVEAGLATAVSSKRARKTSDAQNRFDLSVFNYAGREFAPAPALVHSPSRPRDSVTPNDQGESMSLTPEQLEKLGLPADATEEQIDEAFNALPDPSTGDDPDPDPQDPPSDPNPVDPPGGDPDPAPQASTSTLTLPKGVAAIDEEKLAQLTNTAAQVDVLVADKRKAECKAFLDKAQNEGRFKAKLRAQFEQDWTNNEASVRATVALLEPGTVPTGELGHEIEAQNSTQDDAYPAWMMRGAKKVGAQQ